MDSANSGSLQSSSGGDEEYDSRGESISAFLNPLPMPPPPSSSHQTHASLFDPPLSNYFDPLSRSPQLPNPNSYLNLDIDWSKTLRSDPTCTPELGGASVPSPATAIATTIASSSSAFNFSGSSQPQPQPQPQQQQQQQRGGGGVGGGGAGGSFLQNAYAPPPPQVGENAGRGGSPAADQSGNPAPRNPKKRSRASRRAPTTVLTTDTTNFRAMVQEFTGIPAPPFTAAAHGPFPRSRLDLFGAPSSIRSGGPFDTAPYSLLRPFAQKLHQQQQSPFSFSNDSARINAAAAGGNTAPLGFEIQQPQQQQHNLNLLNMQMQNPMFTFQSLLQSPPKYPLVGSINKSPASLDISGNDSSPTAPLKMATGGGGGGGGGVLEEFGLGQAQVSHTMVLPSSEPPAPSRAGENSINVVPPSWGDCGGGGGGGGGGGQSNGNGGAGDHHNHHHHHHHHHHHGALGATVNGNGSGYGELQLQRNLSNGKIDNYGAAAADFLGGCGGGDNDSNGKAAAAAAAENVSTRSEGMVESWICSSD